MNIFLYAYLKQATSVRNVQERFRCFTLRALGGIVAGALVRAASRGGRPRLGSAGSRRGGGGLRAAAERGGVIAIRCRRIWHHRPTQSLNLRVQGRVDGKHASVAQLALVLSRLTRRAQGLSAHSITHARGPLGLTRCRESVGVAVHLDGVALQGARC